MWNGKFTPRVPLCEIRPIIARSQSVPAEAVPARRLNGPGKDTAQLELRTLPCRITGTSDGNLGLQQFGELDIDWSARVVNRWPAVTEVM